MSLTSLSSIRRVLCLGAHPDDVEIGCGGLLLRLAAEAPGVEIDWVVCSGDATRAAEARDSAAEFLAPATARLRLFDFPDARFPEIWGKLKQEIATLADAASYDLVLTHRIDDGHQDHRVVAELTRQHFRNHDVLEYEVPKVDGDLGRPCLYVPLSEAAARRKAESMVRLFPSQADKPWFTSEVLLALARVRGVEARAEFAEAFFPWKLTAR